MMWESGYEGVLQFVLLCIWLTPVSKRTGTVIHLVQNCEKQDDQTKTNAHTRTFTHVENETKRTHVICPRRKLFTRDVFDRNPIHFVINWCWIPHYPAACTNATTKSTAPPIQHFKLNRLIANWPGQTDAIRPAKSTHTRTCAKTVNTELKIPTQTHSHTLFGVSMCEMKMKRWKRINKNKNKNKICHRRQKYATFQLGVFFSFEFDLHTNVCKKNEMLFYHWLYCLCMCLRHKHVAPSKIGKQHLQEIWHATDPFPSFYRFCSFSMSPLSFSALDAIVARQFWIQTLDFFTRTDCI